MELAGETVTTVAEQKKEKSSTYSEWTENLFRKKDIPVPPAELDWRVISGESSAATPLALALNNKDVRKIRIT